MKWSELEPGDTIHNGHRSILILSKEWVYVSQDCSYFTKLVEYDMGTGMLAVVGVYHRATIDEDVWTVIK